MSVADVAQIAGAGFTAITAVAALATVRHVRSESLIAEDAFEAQTQPLVTDVPRGLLHQEIDWQEASGRMGRRLIDKSEIIVGASGPEPISHASVPVRNVGNGCARITSVTFVLDDGAKAAGEVNNPVLPPGEYTHAILACGPQDAGVEVAESIGLTYRDFGVILGYADASGRPREAARLDVSNGRYPSVIARRWGASVEDLH
jgi:hypothetical protein